MGSTDSGAAEFSVGSIVWVRRRNGSWWPGKIVGPEELSASHLTSPRSGTPVKLLGREDASVDWYNLEKSKRVKAFRCGEFDDCIERAESSQGMPIKKREKYARREDAILHALELEKQQSRKQGKLGVVASDGSNHKSASGALKKGLVTPSQTLGSDNVKLGNFKSNQIPKSKKPEVSPKNEIIGSPLFSQKSKEGNQLSGEEDHSDVIPRMRGLQDFGLKIIPSKTPLSSFVASNGFRKPIVENVVETLPSGGSKIRSASHMNGKVYLDKRKRLLEELGEEYLVKRRDKRRPLVQVLQSSAKLEEVPQSAQFDSATVSTSISGGMEPMGAICKAKRSKCVYFPADSSESLDCKAISQSDIEMSDSQNETFPHPSFLTEENISSSSEDESDTSETELSECETDSSETEDMDEEMAVLSDVVPTEPEVSSLGRHDAQEHGIMDHEDRDEAMLTSDMSEFYAHYPSSAHEAVSKWQLKGKRNIRSLTKRSVDATEGKGLTYDGVYPEEKDFRGEMIGLDNGYSSRAAFRDRNSLTRNLVEWDDWSVEDRPSVRGYWDIKRERFDPVYEGRHQYGGRSRSILIDVDIKVQASYQKGHVPIVSLMSKLNGQAIIGHPMQIELLEDGSSSNLIPPRDDFGNEAIENDGNTTLPQAWRTARRTANFRVPRPRPSSALDGDEAGFGFPYLDRENKPPSKKSNFGSFSHKGSLVRRNTLHSPGPPFDRKYKKSPKKASLSSSQKTRTLSSIAIEHNFGNHKAADDCSSSQMDVLMKPESSGHTTVACIPVQLVFSRLLEKINRPPSKAAAAAASSVALLNSNSERNPP